MWKKIWVSPTRYMWNNYNDKICIIFFNICTVCSKPQTSVLQQIYNNTNSHYSVAMSTKQTVSFRIYCYWRQCDHHMAIFTEMWNTGKEQGG